MNKRLLLSRIEVSSILKKILFLFVIILFSGHVTAQLGNGNNLWNVNCYNGGDVDLTGSIFRGSYTENRLSFETMSRWGMTGSPSSANSVNGTAYSGSVVNSDNFVFVYKRQGFPYGTYTLSTSWDDGYKIFINGSLISSAGGWSSTTGIWTGVLDETSIIEYRVLEASGNAFGTLYFSHQAIGSGTTTSIAAGQCVTLVDHALTNGYGAVNSSTGGYYSNGVNGYVVLNAVSNSKVAINGWTALESTFDYVKVYNGAGTSGTLLASASAAAFSAFSYTGTAGQTLTLQFYSDGSTVNAGFLLDVTHLGISSFTPSSACSGVNVVLTGTGFKGATAVKINGVSASYTVNSNTQITLTVPVGASTGAITVETPYGTATSVTNFVGGTVPAAITGTTTICVGATSQLVTGLSSTDISGGTITTAAGYRIHTFTGNSSLVIPAGMSGTGEALIVAGGGGGGWRHAGGGGAGGLIYNTSVSLSGTMAATVGAGGAGSTGGTGGNGGNSIFAGLTAIGGGYGSTNGTPAGIGGSGGGGSNSIQGRSGTSGQGNRGGNQGGGSSETVSCCTASTSCGCYAKGCGGGGAGAAGANATGDNGSAGGVGLSNSITGSAVFYAGGGGGGRDNAGAYAGGNGGGGAGGTNTSLNGVAGTANTGGGGGGGGANGSTSGNGGNGGSGIVIVRYLSPGTWTSSNTAVATVGATTGIVTGVSGGTATITYTNSSGCSVTTTVTVSSVAAPIYTAANITIGPVPGVIGTALLPDANFNTLGSEYASHESYRGRLFNMGPGVRAWAPAVPTNYWQVDLGSIKPVNGIITQGRGDLGCTVSCSQWTITYEVRVSTDNVNWTSLGVFNGNTDETTPVTNMFANQTTNARYVRVYPLTFSVYPVTRFEIISIPSLCASGAQSVSMSAEPPAGADAIRWYAASSGGPVLQTAQFYTASVSATTNYYAASYNTVSGCESSTRTMVTAQVAVAVSAQPAGAANVPAICTDFVSAMPTGWTTNHQAIGTPSLSSTHDCSGLAASMNASGHYVWVRYNANATNVRYTLKLNNSASTAVRYLLVEQSVDGCVWTPVTIHTNSTVATDLSIVEFTASLNTASRHVRFNMTRRDASGGKIELDNVIVYNGSLPSVSIAPSGSSQTCKVYGGHWVNFYTASNELIGSVKANGALDGTTNDLGDVTLTVNAGSAGSMFACNTSNNPLYQTAYMGRSWTVSSTNFPNSANFASAVSFRAPFSTADLTALNSAATATTGNPNDNGATASNMMLTKISGGTPVNFSPTDNCGNGTITGISQSANGALTAAYPTMSTAGSYVDFSVGQFSEMYLHKNFSASPLPVTLTALSAHCGDQKEVVISWTTASEENSQKFIVEKSRDMIHWMQVAEKNAAGNSNYIIEYSAADQDPFGGVSYYRLIQVDNDGVEKIYGPISVSCSGQDNSMMVFPNPSQGNFTVEIVSSESLDNAEIQLTDLSGKVISSRILNIAEGKNQVLFDETTLQMGTYIVRLTSGSEFKPVKVVVN